MEKTLKIDSIRTLENPEAQSIQDDLLDVAKEAGYTHVYDSNKDITWEIDKAIKHFQRT